MPDNTVVIASPVMDMGQHMKTTGPMILADEMDLDWELIQFAEDCPTFLNKNKKDKIGYEFSDMGTGGSHAVRRNWDYMRNAGATARQMFIDEAAAIWKVSPESLNTRASFVINSLTQQKLSYGYLAKGAAVRQVEPGRVKLKQIDQYTIMGKDTKTIDLKQIVTGKPLFGIDADYPDALQVVIHRAPAQGTKVKLYNKTAALAVKGVIDVVEFQQQNDKTRADNEKQIVSSGVAAIADSLWAAMQGKKALQSQW
jgi:isoquinoline 1-oxidoreductase beta subunit